VYNYFIKTKEEEEMKNYKVTIKGESGVLMYEVYKTLKGANGLGKRIANEAFYGEEVEIIIEAL
jgi:hypothetical protein